MTLKQKILNDIKTDKKALKDYKTIKSKIKNKTATYLDATNYSKSLGDAVSRHIKSNLNKDISTEELKEFAKSCLAPVYSNVQNTMISVCASVQQIYNDKAGIKLKPVEVKRDSSRINHIIDRFNDAEAFEDVEFLIGENVTRSIARGALTDCIMFNAIFHKDSGLKTIITRSDNGGCCEWCSGVAGTFNSYDNLPKDFWAVHRNCSCTIDYEVQKSNPKIRYMPTNQ